MESVTTALVLAIFAGIFWPHALRNRKQFYMAIGAVLLIILVGAFKAAIASDGFNRASGFIIAILQFFGILAIVLSASGKSASEFAEDTIEVIRRGEEEKEIIIPRRGGTPPQAYEDEPPPRIDLGSTQSVTGKAPLRPARPPQDTSIPLEE